MSYKGVLLPLTKYRVGAGPSMDEVSVVVPADTIFGALCWSYAYLYGGDECSVLVKSFADGQPPFLLSSGFPAVFYRGVATILLPAPVHEFFHRTFSTKLGDGKRRISYVSLRALNMLIERREEELKIDNINGYSAVKVEDESLPSIRIVREHRNTLDRLTRASDLYRLSYVKLASNTDGVCGICLLLKPLEGFRERKLIATVRAMCELGLGGERSLGVGVSMGSPVTFDIQLGKSDGEGFMTLSPYCPTRREVERLSSLHYKVYYSLTRRTAYYPTIGIFQYYCFSEGSCFPKLGEERLLGKTVQVHGQVIRYSYAFPVWWDY